MQIITYPIKPEKGKAWHWISHQYFTKQAANVVSAYIEHYSKKGDTVLDPFCGTGVTAIEALRLERKAIVSDLNPLSCFITKQTCAQINIDKFLEVFNELKKEAEPQIKKIFNMTEDEANDLPLEHWYPQKITLPNNSDFEFVEDLFSRKQLLSFSFLFSLINKIDGEEMRQMMRYVFSATISKVNKTYWDNPNRGPEGGGSSIFGAYRYHKPKHIIELDVWKNFSYRFKKILNGKKVWNELTHKINVKENLTVIHCSAVALEKYIPANSIDYIYTDPPYGGHIAYLDLSTMWNAWLGFPVSEEMKQNEIIEGGDLQKTQNEYTVQFSKSFEQMGRVLKKDGWLSCVFAHKKLEYWNVIIDSCEDNGMEFKGSVYQPTNNSSIHYKKNPANILCSQRIANFQKTLIKPTRHKPDDLEEFILNEMNRACIERQGASIDYIYQKVLDKLLQNMTLSDAKKKGYLKLDKFLDDKEFFVFEPETNQYFVKRQDEGHKAFAEDYFRYKDQVEICLVELLTKNNTLTINQIHKELFDIFADDKRFPLDKDKDIEELLPKIAYKDKKTGKWSLIKNRAVQIKIGFEKVLTGKLIKINSDGYSHSEMIFRLVLIGRYLGFDSWIGKREQAVDQFQGYKFSEISLQELPIENIDGSNKDKIKQVDVIWFDKLRTPRYAFEVEESTSIVSGLERFKFLLECDSTLANHLFIVAPKSRQRKLYDIFSTSSYIGHPLYMDNKVKFIFKENLVTFYDTHIDNDFTETDLRSIFDSLKN